MKLFNLIIFIYSSPFLIPYIGEKYFSRIKIHLKSLNIDLKITIRLRRSLKIWKFHVRCVSICVKFLSLEMAGWTGVITSERIEQFSETLPNILRNRVVKFADTEQPFTFTRQKKPRYCLLFASIAVQIELYFLHCVKKIFFCGSMVWCIRHFILTRNTRLNYDIKSTCYNFMIEISLKIWN